MDILNIKKTERNIIFNKLSEDKKFRSFFILSLLSALTIFDHSLLSTLNFSILYDLSYFLIVVLGVYMCFKTNKNGDHKHFIERFLILSLPILMIHLIIFLTILLVIIFFIILLNLNYPNSNLIILFQHVITISIFIRINRSLKNISLS
ncbi:MAG: hypothetical protein CMP39_05355 [Rickettsiales bacterium]|nr:hypothetical protein [Rickettsiales bacterium]